MATYHCTVKTGAKGKASPHAAYIAREGKYEHLRSGEKLEYVEHGNMPKWAEHNPQLFWQAADQFERANGAAYREIEVALPRELNAEQRIELVKDFVQQELGGKHAYTFAIHNPPAALERGEQPHAHIMYSERLIDGHQRDPDQYFKRYNAKEPERGGCQKSNFERTAEERKEALIEQRERWANTHNKHMEMAGQEARVDHRSLKDQGLERSPEFHLGSRGVRSLSDRDISNLLEHRKAEGELERTQGQVRSLDLSGDIQAACRERDAKERERLEKAAQIKAQLTKKLEKGADAFVKKYEALMQQKQREMEREKELSRSRSRGRGR